ncbi:hypothetical protein LguiB_028880 [Lonicera macranthoides]
MVRKTSEPAVFIGQELIGGANENEIISLHVQGKLPQLLINAGAIWIARLGAICGAGVVKGFQGSSHYETLGDGANFVNHGYTKGDGLDSEIVGTFVLVYTVFSATDAKRSARDSHVPILAPLSIGFVVFLVHFAIIPITRTGINPARSLGAAIIYNKGHARDGQGPDIEEVQEPNAQGEMTEVLEDKLNEFQEDKEEEQEPQEYD